MSVTRVQLVGNVSTGASFVGVVTATSFIGNVTGNASYASVAGVATYASVAGVSTYASVAGAPGGGGGTAALPAIAFDGDPNTGIYSPGADQLAVATNGTGRLFINSTGLVGIGTSSVGARFHIEDTDSSSAYSTASILGTQTSVYKQIVHTNQSTGTNEAGIVLRAGTSSNIAEWGISALRTGATSGDLIFRSRTGASTSAEFMRLTSTGLGIGVPAPSYQLDLGGGTTVNTRIQIARGSDDSNAMRIGYNTIDLYRNVSLSSAQTGLAINQVGSDGTRNVFQIDSSGRLLVGTSTARSNFYNTTADAGFLLEGTGAQRRAAVIGDDFGAALILGMQKSGAPGGNTIVANGDGVGEITFQGNDGSEFVACAQIKAEIDGTPGANDMPGRIVYWRQLRTGRVLRRSR
jgi:hypothetical protein